MSNSPPSKVSFVKSDSTRSLCSGVDTIVLTLEIIWKSEDLFNRLSRAKAEADFINNEIPIELKSWDEEINMFFDVRPYGSRGYEWVLINREYSLYIGNWIEPSQRPSVLIEIRSETLHMHGVQGAIGTILAALTYAQADIKIIRVTRVDLYCDILLPDLYWSMDLNDYLVTRATKRSLHNQGKVFSGFSIGKGDISARLYDKPLEIKQQSGKIWMYDIWGIKEVPTGYRIIRVEFQLRRERIKQLGIDNLGDFIKRESNLWVYCTKKWLKFQDKPGKHHSQRHTFYWWKVVQTSYEGTQNANPLVSMKAACCDEEKLVRQFIGIVSSIIASRNHGKMASDESITNWIIWITRAFPQANNFGARPKDISDQVRSKMAKHSRSSNAYAKATRERKIHDLILNHYCKEQLAKERKIFNERQLLK
jgi:hypothetical protein